MSTPERTLHAVDLAQSWSPSSWRARPALQMPQYPDAAALEAALAELRQLPPLVTSWEIFALKKQLAEAQEGKRFLLQGGDCAENFSDCESGTISNRLKVLLQMSLVLVHGLRLPVVRVGRFAGQYAKPRSADLETRGEVSLPSYRGDVVNGPAFTAEARVPDPRRWCSTTYGTRPLRAPRPGRSANIPETRPEFSPWRTEHQSSASFRPAHTCR